VEVKRRIREKKDSGNTSFGVYAEIKPDHEEDE